MTQGLMQTAALRIIDILRFAATAHPKREVVSRLVDEPIWRSDYQGLYSRASALANALRRMGVQPGDRVASLAWNTHRHLELFYAVPGVGAVLHTANPRLSDDQIAYTLNHGGSRILFFDKSFLPIVERLRARLETIATYVMLSDSAGLAPDIVGYEDLIGSERQETNWEAVEENSGAFLCYTSGTTGDPKGVVYSHRSIVLHAFAAGLSGAFGFSAFDVVMPCSSLYHATAWGLPFAAPLNGCKLVLPCEKMDGASLHELIESEGVTFTGGVPTIWTMYLAYLEKTGTSPSQLQRVVIGGSAVPRAMAETFKTRYGVTVLQIWGMTETCPLGVVATPTPALSEMGPEAMDDIIWTRQGRLQFGIELRIEDEDGRPLPWDGESSGALLVRGPWTIQRYYRKDEDAANADGWFDTGDIATIDSNGFMRITDRKKDVIKSGGEWISSIDLENAASACRGVKIAAVIGAPHPKWEERPILVIERHDNEHVSEADIRAHLEPLVARWWMPDRIVFDTVPLTATGKIDKKTLRRQYADLLLGSA
jgi:fatty-acyl-CoA synthase